MGGRVVVRAHKAVNNLLGKRQPVLLEVMVEVLGYASLVLPLLVLLAVLDLLERLAVAHELQPAAEQLAVQHRARRLHGGVSAHTRRGASGEK